ncbi:AAA family ATPase [Kribbella qitaiheensis]|uniref:AAA family ATPase n=1 Tax=Kribbella qitaiheensis TaxID=1544730 RepID=A0A7G6WSQ6_9ACTN|nr:IS21-like element helper ATPase IstB [Kribbella qitaiheensis]QNE16623.1 AAA family ATPase [Kribbella qitaiheensis]QNE17021.1 AAA family ATPase [Kribbella qitaiheensis]QNE17942.1 AAA family ATPase [Kribbella qitaiheensis]QNE18254.1 AAA family ATPase [Kribbella qitaiheensis]QNE18455.1 AAA family ATPase [Kribbella qitaiheensis]
MSPATKTAPAATPTTTVTALSDPAAEAAIHAACRLLALPTIRAEAIAMAEASAKQRLTHKAFLAEILTAECDERDARRRIRRVNEAKFPRTKRLTEFDHTVLPDLPAPTLAHLAGGGWIDAGQPLVLLGDSGTGKTHLLIALGTAAAEQGRRVRYVTTAALVNELVEASDDKQLSRVVGRYARLDLLCLDEIGYVRLDPRGAELLFQIITAREERASIACASNAPFSEWGATFTDPRLAAAVVDRLTFNAHIIQTGTKSYRLNTTRQTRSRTATN